MNQRISRRSLLAVVAALAFSGTAFAQQFTDVSVAAGMHRDFTRAWGNPMWGDFNRDGLLDLFVPNHEAPGPDNGIYPYIYLNNGDGTFTDVIATSGIVTQNPDTAAWQGISIGDYDGDGNLDIYISEPPFQGGGNAPTRDLLFKGNGDGTWSYVSDVAGIVTARNYGECSFFVDYDNDGNIDIFVKNIPNDGSDTTTRNVLYHNNGDGTFSMVDNAGGLADAEHGIVEGTLCSFIDYDNDGYMDVIFAGNGASEELYHNNRDGTFAEVTVAAGLVPAVNVEGIAWGDYNNDGLIDLYLSRGKQSGSGVLGNQLYRNNGDGTFTDVTGSAHVDDGTNTWAAAWGDYDNDGLLDLYVTRPGTPLGTDNSNLLYHNNGDGTFTDVAVQEGVDLTDSGNIMAAHKLCAWGDYDNDGFLDLVEKDGIGPNLITGNAYIGQHFLFKNNGNANHYIKLNLQGVQSNLHGIGARVAVIHDGAIAFRENNGGGGGEWASQGAGPMHFGIGTSTTATIRITWPSGIVDVVPSVDADTTMTVIEGSSPPPVVSQNISTRLDVLPGDGVGIAGFIITGTTPKKVLIRGLGPSLAAEGITDFLADPVLQLNKPFGVTLINDNWKDTQQIEIAATQLAPMNDSEAAIVATLIPGQYTAILSGANGTSGIGLVEVYDLDQGITSELANVSTRGSVATGENVMIGGVIIGPVGAPNATVVVRAIGPSLAAKGVPGSLADPTLELRDANGALIASDDNWQDDPTQAASIEAAGIAPTDPRESAIYITLPTGTYTAVVQGKDGTSGVALVEAYNIK